MAPAAAVPEAVRSPLWASRRQLLRVALCLAASVLAAAALFIEFERREIIRESLSRSELYARILEQQVSALLNSSDSGMRTINDTLDELLPRTVLAGDGQRIGAMLADAFSARPFVRSTSLLTSDGRVIASSSPGNVGAFVNLVSLGSMPLPEQGTSIGPLRIGRDLTDLAVPVEGGQGSPVLPLLRSHVLPGGETVHLVQVLNLDYFAGQFDLALESATTHAALSSYQGLVLTGTVMLKPEPGHSLSRLGVFTRYLPRTESGSYVGPGLNGPDAALAFRTLRKWPLVVMVEVPWTVVMERLRQLALLAGAVAGVVLVLLAGSTVLVLRSLARHEDLLDDIDEVNRQAAASDARNNAVLDSALDGILTIDARDTIVAFNPAAERIFGFQAAQAVGRSMTELLVPPSLHRVHSAGMQRYLLTGGAGSILNRRREVQALHADGHVFPMELTVVAVRSHGEQFFTATVRDITEQKRAEVDKARLLRTFSQLNKDLETEKRALDAHAIVSISDTQGRITYANDKLLAISGRARDELIGKKYRETDAFTLGAHDLQQMRACFGRHEAWHGETSHRRKDGSLYWTESSVIPVFDVAGQLQKIVTVQTDISARRKAEMALGRARDRELEIGSRIQQALLMTPPSQPHAELWICAFNQASRGIDGDFFDLIKVGSDAIDVVAGDVMGKGIPAALMGAATKLQFSRSIAELLIARAPHAALPQPAEIVTAVNAAMAPHLQALEAFVTLVYLRIDLKANTVTWVGCGHEEPLLVDTRDKALLLENQHPPIGLFLTEQYVQSVHPLREGDAIFLCSDGASDAMRDNGERVGRHRVNRTVARHVQAYQDPAMVLHAVRRDLLLNGVTIADDLTMVMLSRNRLDRHQARIEVPVSLASLRKVREFVQSQAMAAGLPEESASLLAVAVVEVVTNVIRHAQGLVPEAPIALVLEDLPTSLVLEVMYLGEHYDPPQDAPESDFAAFPEGGFGMYIIQNVAQSTDYLHHKGVNTVRMLMAKPAALADQLAASTRSSR